MTQLTTDTTTGTLLPTGTWRVDPSHSRVEFGIKHLLITTVKGSFTAFNGSIIVGEDGTAHAEGVIGADSIDTNEPQRDEHLRSPDFFAAADFPELHFRSTSIGDVDGRDFRVDGELTIRGTTRPIELHASYDGQARDPYGNDRIGLTIRGRLDPTEYGVDWNQELETGGNLLGDRVDFTATISAVREA